MTVDGSKNVLSFRKTFFFFRSPSEFFFGMDMCAHNKSISK